MARLGAGVNPKEGVSIHVRGFLTGHKHEAQAGMLFNWVRSVFKLAQRVRRSELLVPGPAASPLGPE